MNAIIARHQNHIGRSMKVYMPYVLAWPWYRRIWKTVVATVGPVL